MKVLVTGGARSGKSTFAESLYNIDNVIYVATYISNYDDVEMCERVEKHIKQRNSLWSTIEVDTVLNISEENVILDCLSIFVSNVMFHYINENEFISDNEVEQITKHIETELSYLLSKCNNIVIVTNEVGMGIVPDNQLSRVYRDILGRVNRFVADYVDDVYLVVCGQNLKIK